MPPNLSSIPMPAAITELFAPENKQPSAPAPTATAPQMPSCATNTTLALKDLTSTSASTRKAALTKLAWYGEMCSVLPMMKIAISDPDRDVRARAISVSSRIIEKNPSAVELADAGLQLYRAVANNTNEDPIVRKYALEGAQRVIASNALYQATQQPGMSGWWAKTKLFVSKHRIGVTAGALVAIGAGSWYVAHKYEKDAAYDNGAAAAYRHVARNGGFVNGRRVR